ncbi:MAG TPA: hypothetical protein VNT76_24265 [Candidatus Binatus sp.]|nr:hypothetical protein [Candidatus Binatus sp.]
MESGTDWKIILAIAVAAILKEVADAIRAWANRRFQKRIETKMDGNTALCATTLVSSGNLPKAAPCIPAVAKAVSSTPSACESAVEYATNATAVAHQTMEREGIPIQSNDLRVKTLQATIEEIRIKEERHAENNAAWNKQLREDLEWLKSELAKKTKTATDVPP